jgi:sialate O-acetylesterase
MISNSVEIRSKHSTGLGGLLLVFFIAMLLPVSARADVRLPAIFSDHMVLMRGADVPIWGKAAPGENVRITIGAADANATASDDGRWMIHLNLSNVARGPYQMEVNGKNRILIADVLIGAVWLAAGQSNMEHKLKATLNAEREIESSADVELREFRVKKVMKAEPADDCEGHWVVAAPEATGDFSAVAYYFARRLRKTLEIPVGIIDASWSGTYSELWISHEAIESVDSLRSGEAARQKLIADFHEQQEAWIAKLETWIRENHREDRPNGDPSIDSGDTPDASAWTPIQMPGVISKSSGAFWIRKEVDVPADVASPNQEFKVMIGRLNGFEQVYWNGVKVSETPYSEFPGEGYARYFPIPANLLRPSRNTIALRIYAPEAPPEISVDLAAFKAGPIHLAGEWLRRTEFEFPPLAPEALAAMPAAPAQVSKVSASGIFNGVIHPLIPFGLDGIIWYQGESDTARAAEYGIVFPLLIEDWRKEWHQADLPFLFCQLPASGPKLTQPQESQWAELRESQSKALLLPDTAEAVLIDLGESDDLHFRRKDPVGECLARIAFSRVYGKNEIISGPVYEKMQMNGNKVEISLTHAEGGLSAHKLPVSYDVSTLLGIKAPLIATSPGSEIQGFTICGPDRRWVWADAKIVNANTVEVWSDQVANPVAVRYGWADNPTVNLYNGAGLPAVPFRTDSFPPSTLDSHFGPGT